MEKLGSEIAIPDGRFLLVAIASCCMALVLTGWPPTRPFRQWVGIPFLAFCFDLSGTAIGAFIPAILAAATPPEWRKALVLVVLAFIYLVIMTSILWLGKYLLSQRFQDILQSYPAPYPYFVSVGAAFVLLFMYFGGQ